MDISKIPAKLKYTSAEKVGEAVSIALTLLVFVGGEKILLYSLGTATFASVITGIVILLLNGGFTACSVFPQWTNIAEKADKCTEENLHKLRRQCIICKLIFASAVVIVDIVMLLI